MAKIPVHVGIDYSQSGVQVSVQGEDGVKLRNRKCRDTWQAVAGQVKTTESVHRAAIEACTGAADLAEELRQYAGWPVELAMPGIVKKMKLNPDKSDYQDADILADLARIKYVPRVWLTPKPVRELRIVVRYRQQLVDQRRAAKLRIGAILRDQRVVIEAKRWSKPWRAALTQSKDLSEQARWVVEQHQRLITRLMMDIACVETRLAELAQEDWMVKELLAYKGIGLVTAAVIRAEVGSFARFKSAKALSRYCALTPRNASSGTRQADAGVIQAGNRRLRTVLIEAGHRLARLDPRWRALAASLRERGKHTNVVVVAVANRWMRGLYQHGKRVELGLAA